MQCPNDQTTLAMTERQGIEIDYCPTCRGVWLDRGELDKLIEGSSQAMPQSNTEQPHLNTNSYPQHPKYSDDHYSYKKKHKRESFLGDLFDF